MANGHGGRRPGAGRKKGTVTKRTQEIAKALTQDGELLPLEYMLKVMRDPDECSMRRDDMAKAAAPFLHARLASTVLSVEQKHELADYTDDELADIIRSSRPGGDKSEAGATESDRLH